MEKMKEITIEELSLMPKERLLIYPCFRVLLMEELS